MCLQIFFSVHVYSSSCYPLSYLTLILVFSILSGYLGTDCRLSEVKYLWKYNLSWLVTSIATCMHNITLFTIAFIIVLASPFNTVYIQINIIQTLTAWTARTFFRVTLIFSFWFLSFVLILFRFAFFLCRILSNLLTY